MALTAGFATWDLLAAHNRIYVRHSRRRSRLLRLGPIAQWLEPAAHNGLVAGSSPARPTIKPSDIVDP